MRADRLLQIMILLQNRGKMTTRQLAERLEVSERTILRDMDALSVAGIPVTAERGKYGGWTLVDGFRSTISGLKLDELKSLFILPSDHLLAQLGIGSDGPDVRRKLAATMPRAVKDSARHYLEKIHIDTGTWKPAGDGHTEETLRLVLSALWGDRTLRIRYRKAGGERTERVVRPLGLVAKGSVWYVVALNETGETRTYRMSRIMQADVLDETFARPEHFDLAAYWKQSKEQFAASLPRFEVHVLADPAIVGRLTFTDRFVQAEIGETGGDGMVAAVLHFHTEEEAAAYVVGFGGQMKIVRPESLISRVVEKAGAALALYEGKLR